MPSEYRHGDALATLREMPAESVDAVITDPPYGLSNTNPANVADTIARWATGEREYTPAGKGFMGKAWDSFVPPPAVWDECYRVLKPGGHIAVFAGSRTQDLMGLSIRLAGFDIRDSIAWLYGSGFPKSLDVSKAIDKGGHLSQARAKEFQAWLREHMTPKQVNEATGTDMGHHLTTHPTQPAVATEALFARLRPHLPEVPERIERLVAERTGANWDDYKRRHVIGLREVPKGHAFAGSTYGGDSRNQEYADTKAHTPEAERWQGWGTALKPAHEPIILARKPFPGTVAANVQEHGTGALNIDATRIGTEGGRWPANVALDADAAEELDRQSGILKNGGQNAKGPTGAAIGAIGITERVPTTYAGDTGGASRFFYCSKAPTKERPNVDGISHPTVKPLELMKWLCRMVTPPNGLILDPFAGSGTTLEAAEIEGFHSIGIEADATYLPLIAARLERAAGAA